MLHLYSRSSMCNNASTDWSLTPSLRFDFEWCFPSALGQLKFLSTLRAASTVVDIVYTALSWIFEALAIIQQYYHFFPFMRSWRETFTSTMPLSCARRLSDTRQCKSTCFLLKVTQWSNVWPRSRAPHTSRSSGCLRLRHSCHVTFSHFALGLVFFIISCSATTLLRQHLPSSGPPCLSGSADVTTVF